MASDLPNLYFMLHVDFIKYRQTLNFKFDFLLAVSFSFSAACTQSRYCCYYNNAPSGALLLLLLYTV